MTIHRIVAPATRAEIEDLNARFAWAIDLHEWETLHELFAPDAHYVSVGREFHSRAEIVASFSARGSGRHTRHGLGVLLLSEREDGTITGRSSWHTFASNDAPAGGAEPEVGLYMVADFHDTYARSADGGWRIAERLIIPVFRTPELAP